MIIEIPEIILWAIPIILIVLFITFAIILSYHWNHYGINENNKKVANVVYFFVSAVIISIIVFFIIFYGM